MFSLNKTVQHYIKLSQNYRDDKITLEQLQETVERDIQAHISMFNKGLLTDVEYDSYKLCVSEFEDLFEEIEQIKKQIKIKSNGKA